MQSEHWHADQFLCPLTRQGHIYGLLGPSGCGKTTLLRCVVGRLKPTGGAVRVLGHSPGSIGKNMTRASLQYSIPVSHWQSAPAVESGIPGPKVGYMPQELALFVDFTVSETIFYFGRVHGMSSEWDSTVNHPICFSYQNAPNTHPFLSFLVYLLPFLSFLVYLLSFLSFLVYLLSFLSFLVYLLSLF